MNASDLAQPTSPALPLPDTFAFSQSSLQAYEDCQRRFWLAYVEQLPWPAIEAAPVQEHEQLMRLGSTFHRLIHRAEVGLDPDLLLAGLEAPLAGWFHGYLRYRPADLPTTVREVEHTLTIPFPNPPTSAQTPAYRIAAKYDLIAIEPGERAVIVDWKTTRQRTDPAILRQRLQTWVYPYLLVEASRRLPWGPLQPEQVEMRYWFTSAPAQPVIFRHDQAQHAAAHDRLHGMLQQILSGNGIADFPKVPDTPINRKRFCNFCVYRSRCDRGVTAGDVSEVDDPESFFTVDFSTALEFTLDELPELAF